MPLLAAFLGTVLGGLAEFFVKVLGKKLAIATASVGVFGGMTVALFAAVSAVFMAVPSVYPDAPGFAIGIWVATPPGVSAAIAAAISVDALVVAYRWNVENLRFVMMS